MGVVSSKLPILHRRRKVGLNDECPICLCKVEEKSLAWSQSSHRLFNNAN